MCAVGCTRTTVSTRQITQCTHTLSSALQTSKCTHTTLDKLVDVICSRAINNKNLALRLQHQLKHLAQYIILYWMFFSLCHLLEFFSFPLTMADSQFPTWFCIFVFCVTCRCGKFVFVGEQSAARSNCGFSEPEAISTSITDL